jgi:D-alanine--poly(phosphoribitol) ligase subunit 1
MIFGGERFPINSIRKIKNYYKNTEFYNVSGPTECTCICSAHKVTKKEINNLDNIPVGNLNSYFKYKILPITDKKNVGELVLIGPSISQGYHNNRSLIKQNFFVKKGNFGYKTGDIVKKVKNNFLILGRIDNQIKFMGHRIELEEIENVIIKKHNLNECLVLVKKTKKFPYEKLTCYINSKYKKKIKESKFTEILPYYMQPKEIIFLKKFQYNKNGKIDRKFYNN